MTEETTPEVKEALEAVIDKLGKIEENAGLAAHGHGDTTHGPGLLWGIPSYRGSTSVDNNEVIKELESLDMTNRRAKDPIDVKYQDILIPTDSEGPKPPHINKLVSEIIEQAAIYLQRQVVVDEKIWSIQHGYMEQTFPHDHDIGPNEYAIVYWAQVPEGSGVLEFWPLGMQSELNLEILVEPKEGEFFMFPGWLLHGVRHNTNADEKRISLSLNLSCDPDKLAGLELSTKEVPNY